MRLLQPTTEAGSDLIERAERFASTFADAAAHHDREGTYAVDHVAAMRDDGFLYAPLPVELGGLGVTSARDLLVACSRLAQGDPATTIGVNMHFAVLLNAIRGWRIAQRSGRDRRAEAIAAQLGQISAAGVVFAAAISERNQDLRRPATRAEALPDGTGWRVDGEKWFVTMSPAASLLSVGVTYEDADGTLRYGFATVPVGTPGVEVRDDWDGLGMRASGSHSVAFRDVRLPPGAVRDGIPIEEAGTRMLDRYLASGVFHAAASLGIAESAHALAVTTLRKATGNADDGFLRMTLAEATVDLVSVQATFDRAARLVDEADELDPTGSAPVETWSGWFAEVQAAKVAVQAGAARVVDRALSMSGGSGYVASHPLARAYRDVRAGAFMHPLGVNRAHRFVAEAELGLVPEYA